MNVNINKLTTLTLLSISLSFATMQGTTYAADNKTIIGPTKSPLSTTKKLEAESSDSAGRRNDYDGYGSGYNSYNNNNRNMPSSTRPKTKQTLQRNAINQPAQDAATKKTLTPSGGVRSPTAPATYIRTMTERGKGNPYPIAGNNVSYLIQGFSVTFENYKHSIYEYNMERSRCVIKPYTSADKIQAGCTPTMPVRTCEEKLVYHCIRPYIEDSKRLHISLLERYQKVERTMTSIKQHNWSWQAGR